MKKLRRKAGVKRLGKKRPGGLGRQIKQIVEEYKTGEDCPKCTTMRKTLSFYEDKRMYTVAPGGDVPQVLVDQGGKARKALEGKQGTILLGLLEKVRQENHRYRERYIEILELLKALYFEEATKHEYYTCGDMSPVNPDRCTRCKIIKAVRSKPELE